MKMDLFLWCCPFLILDLTWATWWVSCRKQRLPTLPEHLSLPRFFGGIHVAHMFLVLTAVCIVLVLSSLFSGVRQLFSIFIPSIIPLVFLDLTYNMVAKIPTHLFEKILLNNWIWYQALIKDIQKASNQNQILEEEKKKKRFWNLSTIIFLFLTSWQIKRN